MKNLARVAVAAVLSSGCASQPQLLQPGPFPKWPKADAACYTREVVRRVNPRYPREAMKVAHSGWVIVEYDILESGATANVRIAASSPVGVFDAMAVSSLQQWRYATGPKLEKCIAEIQLKLG